MPGKDEEDFEALEADVYDADDQPAGERHTSEVEALLLAPRSDQSARDLIVDDHA